MSRGKGQVTFKKAFVNAYENLDFPFKSALL